MNSWLPDTIYSSYKQLDDYDNTASEAEPSETAEHPIEKSNYQISTVKELETHLSNIGVWRRIKRLLRNKIKSIK